MNNETTDQIASSLSLGDVEPSFVHYFTGRKINLQIMKIRGVRFIILGVTTLCMASIISNINTYNFTKICLGESDASAVYSSFEKTAILSSTAIGSLAASFPIVIALQKYPSKLVFLSAGLLSAVATALIPFAESQGFVWFMAARIVQGVSFCTIFPMTGKVTAEWAALSEHGIFLAFLTAFCQIGNVFSMPVSGALCSSAMGWRSVYYLHSGLGAALFLLFFMVYEDSPNDHRLVGEEEREWIMRGREKKSESRSTVPYKPIFKSRVVYAVWLAAFADIMAVQFINMYNPQYLKDYLDYDVMNSGFLAALPMIVQWLCKLIAGVSSDAIICIGENIKIRVYNSIALMLSAALFIVLSFIPKSQQALSLAILIFTEGLIGFSASGFGKCATLHTRRHAHFVMMQFTNIQSIITLVEPFFVNSILADNTPSQWRIVFLIHAVIMIASNVVFLIFANARPAEWTEDEKEESGEIETNEKSKIEVSGSPVPTIFVCDSVEKRSQTA